MRKCRELLQSKNDTRQYVMHDPSFAKVHIYIYVDRKDRGNTPQIWTVTTLGDVTVGDKTIGDFLSFYSLLSNSSVMNIYYFYHKNQYGREKEITEARRLGWSTLL